MFGIAAFIGLLLLLIGITLVASGTLTLRDTLGLNLLLIVAFFMVCTFAYATGSPDPALLGTLIASLTAMTGTSGWCPFGKGSYL